MNTPTRIFTLLFACAVTLSAQAQSVVVDITTTDGEPIAGAVIELLLPDSLRQQYSSVSSSQVDQIDKEFSPTVTAVVVGSEIAFPNSDDILHHVYSFSPVKTFNIPLYGSGDNNDYRETFDTPGIVEIGCNIHDWMLAYIYVGESSLMAISDDSGQARLNSLPEGEYQLKIWHPRLADTSDNLETINLSSSNATNLQVQLELVRDRRVRRAPSANRNRYR